MLQMGSNTPFISIDWKKLRLGVLTTENRTTWARLREEIVLNEGLCSQYLVLIVTILRNREMLHKIDTGLFVLCLDSTSPSGSNQISRNMLAGNAENRWYSVTLLFSTVERGVKVRQILSNHSVWKWKSSSKFWAFLGWWNSCITVYEWCTGEGWFL